jgi:Pyridoxamine 5'-phosphate oxidase
MTAFTEEDTMRWAEVKSRQPRLIEFGHRRLLDPGVVLVATIRRDGTPRLSPVEPYVMDGDLWLSMMWGSTKARDLLRDPRILVHSVITSRDGGEGEYKVRGRAEPTDDAAIQRRYADAVADALGWRPVPGRSHLFSVDATGDQFVARWPDGREFVRRGTSATSVGEPEVYHDLLRLSPA